MVGVPLQALQDGLELLQLFKALGVSFLFRSMVERTSSTWAASCFRRVLKSSPAP
jgi:hypothetical protein